MVILISHSKHGQILDLDKSLWFHVYEESHGQFGMIQE